MPYSRRYTKTRSRRFRPSTSKVTGRDIAKSKYRSANKRNNKTAITKLFKAVKTLQRHDKLQIQHTFYRRAWEEQALPKNENFFTILHPAAMGRLWLSPVEVDQETRSARFLYCQIQGQLSINNALLDKPCNIEFVIFRLRKSGISVSTTFDDSGAKLTQFPDSTITGTGYTNFLFNPKKLKVLYRRRYMLGQIVESGASTTSLKDNYKNFKINLPLNTIVKNKKVSSSMSTASWKSLQDFNIPAFQQVHMCIFVNGVPDDNYSPSVSMQMLYKIQTYK